MRSSIIGSSCIQGPGAYPVNVEVNLSNGLPYFNIVGLGDSAVRESAQRVKAAIRNSGLHWPDSRITVNLSPAWLTKKGSAFDLPIALGILQASRQIPEHLKLSSWGELSLTGQIKSAPGALCLADGLDAAPAENIRIHPAEAADEIRLYRADGVYAQTLSSLVGDLKNERITTQSAGPQMCMTLAKDEPMPDEMALPITLQASAWRACMIAVAGCHHLLMLGAAGCGKTTLARASRYLLPPLSPEEQYRLAVHYSAGKLAPEEENSTSVYRFRTPHYSITPAALLGGSVKYNLGEVSLADQGILFLDEISEYKNSVLNLLRQPLEDHELDRMRSGQQYKLPAKFILIAAANPCACGLYFERDQSCTCSDGDLQRYRQKFRNPFFDRIDLGVEMHRIPSEKLLNSLEANQQNPQDFREQVINARERQYRRQGHPEHSLLRLNGWLNPAEIGTYFAVDDALLKEAEQLAERLKLSIRSYQKLLRVARTIADLEDSAKIREEHILEAFSYRIKIQ